MSVAATPAVEILFLDVGQGDCTLVKLPDGRGILVDAGEGSLVTVIKALDFMRVTRLALVAVTHSDIDHSGDVMDVVQNLTVAPEALMTVADRHPRGPRWRLYCQQVAEYIRSTGTPRELPFPLPKSMHWDDVTLEVLHPDDADDMECAGRAETNACAIIFRLVFGGIRVLLGSDLTGQGWSRVRERFENRMDAQILRVSHHGAWPVDGLQVPELLELVQPRLAIISVGTGNSYSHPDPATLRALRGAGIELRIMCTQVTSRCDSDLSSKVALATALLNPSLPRRSIGCPCAGTIAVNITHMSWSVDPASHRHAEVIDLFSQPHCRDA